MHTVNILEELSLDLEKESQSGLHGPKELIDEGAYRHSKSIMHYAPSVFFEYQHDIEGNITLRYLSPEIIDLFSVQTNPSQLNHFYKRLKQLTLLYQQQQSKEGLPYIESQYPLNDGNMLYYNIGIANAIDPLDGQKVFLGYIADISKQRISEKAQVDTNIKYRDTVATMGLGLMELDSNNDLLYVNRSLGNLVGYEPNAMKGKHVTDFFGEEYLSAHYLEGKERPLNNFQLEFKDRGGNKKWCVVNQTINYNAQKEIIGYIAIIIDITDHKVEQHELMNAKKEAEKSASSKELFLANMSHEIRTPMNAIMSMANELSKTVLTPEQKYCLQTIRSASKSLLVIIDDILDLSKIDAGQLNLEYIGFSLQDLLHEVMKFVMHKGEKKGLAMISKEVDRSIAGILIGDPYRINQVILNLLSNAVKFTEKGSVSLEARLLSDEGSYQEIEVIVSDTGIGMDPAFVEHLFDNFTQEFESVSRKYGGTGLGMSISKKLIGQMGGRFNVESEKGIGSTISFILKLEKGLESDIRNEVPISINEDLLVNRKVLIVDDNEMNRLVAATILLNYGAQVMAAESGESAIEMIQEGNFDVILMDIQMPVLNGYETTGRLRNLGYAGPIIALTASAVSGEREKCLSAGMDDYITKPIKEDTFILLIDQWIKDRPYSVEQPIIDQPLYSLEGLLEISKGRQDFVTKMMELFCKQMPIATSDLAEALARKDFDNLSQIAHKLKSTIDNLGIITIQRTIRDIETLSHSDTPLDELSALVNLVIDTVNKVVIELNMEINRRTA